MENTHLTLRVQAQHPDASGCPSPRSEIGPTPSRVVTCAYPADLVTPVTPAVFAAHVHEHPLVSYYRATGDSSPVKISDFLSRERSHRLGLYAEFFQHLPVEHQLAVSLPSPATRAVGIALNRSSEDFAEADRNLIGILRAPLTTALTRAEGRRRARQALTVSAGSQRADLTAANFRSSNSSPRAARTVL